MWVERVVDGETQRRDDGLASVLAAGTHPGADGGELHERPGQIFGGGLRRLHDQAQHVGGGFRLRAVHGGAADTAAPHGDEAFVLQDSQRFSDRRRADGELLDEPLEGRQIAAVGQVAIHDALT